MHTAPPSGNELSAILRLLDDETPEVREQVSQRIALYDGDLSESLSTQAHPLSERDQKLLSEMLWPARRERLIHEWIAPSGGATALREDWESFEAYLRALSDFLHDGISLRQALSDALDLLAEEAEENHVTCASELCQFLFGGTRFEPNLANYYDPRNSDLAWSITQGRSNPIGLCLIFILVGRRLDFEIEGVNFPSHFMCRIFEDGYPIIIDCFDHGQAHAQLELLNNPELDRNQRHTLRQSVDPGNILVRILNNLVDAFQRGERSEDARLMQQLLATLR